VKVAWIMWNSTGMNIFNENLKMFLEKQNLKGVWTELQNE